MNRHEQSMAVIVQKAMLKFRKTRNVTTTSGPGVTNLITPLQDSYSDGIPSCSFYRTGSYTCCEDDAFQECPAIDLTSMH